MPFPNEHRYCNRPQCAALRAPGSDYCGDHVAPWRTKQPRPLKTASTAPDPWWQAQRDRMLRRREVAGQRCIGCSGPATHALDTVDEDGLPVVLPCCSTCWAVRASAARIGRPAPQRTTGGAYSTRMPGSL